MLRKTSRAAQLRFVLVPLLISALWLPEALANAAMIRALGPRISEARRSSPDLGVHVVEVATGDEVYGYRADELQVLASNTKLFTTAAALDMLGAGFEYDTPVLIRGSVYAGALGGDLAVVGSGDPNLSGRLYGGDPYHVFRDWARALKARGVSRVRGDLYLVRGLFDSRTLHPDWPADQLARWYEAPVDSLSFADNCVGVRVYPGARRGAAGSVELVPPVDIFRVVNRVTTTASRRGQRVVVSRAPGSHEILVSGAVYQQSGPVETEVTVPDPVEYFGAALEAALAGEGVAIEGATRIVETLPGDVWERVASARSDLLTTLSVTNQKSQNFYAESLIKLLAARTAGEGSWREGARVVSNFLHRAGLPDGFELADGSGMSRGNRATPRHLTTLLRHMYLRPDGKTFVATLPLSGGDEGTWSYRLRESPYRGNVWAKTGTLSGVSSLSGYARALSGRIYAFSILCNGTGSVWRARRAQDSIVRALVDFG